MPLFGISPEKEAQLMKRMRLLGIKEEEFDESFIRAGGPGGQKINKTSSCVVLRHEPTGIMVKCQEARSQSLNRFIARRRLLDLIEKKQKGFVEEEKKRIEKIRRQKRRRSRRAKEKMLKDKRRRAEKKQRRAAVTREE
ncbi:MAG: peptide chain release factor-like protein [Candidatus Omnitrophica bacterium CG11_big_fil_rev_8_21_14_0_20_42_13]|uniref:Peptide chain release factor-like protein n=1 Tax=Candidatus Ghiorseimicrobium undicola TaxID=1974746 RepID=A0A2H0LVU8_9BACT|nr:MAG: peptide chain release factor-like protein [Candidatus Omnitrophica bacterium CG11_big_fil_rev_8_21_14_0_20_42_13]